MGNLALMKSQRYAHATQFRRHRREVKFLRTGLGRMIRDIDRETADNASLESFFRNELARARDQQQRQVGRDSRLSIPRTEANYRLARSALPRERVRSVALSRTGSAADLMAHWPAYCNFQQLNWGKGVHRPASGRHAKTIRHR